MAMRIGRHLGLERYWNWRSMEEVQRRTIEHYNEEHPDQTIDWYELKEEGAVVLDNGNPIYRAGHGLGPDGTGRAGRELLFPNFDGTAGANRVHLYSTDLERVWRQKIAANQSAVGYEPLPTYYRPRSAPPGHVRLIYGRSPVHSFGRTQNTPVLHGREPENDVWASPATASAFGVTDGELVEIINQDGVREGPIRLKVTARMRDDAIYMTHGHGHNNRQLSRAYQRGADDSALMTRYAVDPLSGGTGMRVNFVRLVRPHAA
jgi:thiosulfate reductase/polysulfide reductase chain A